MAHLPRLAALFFVSTLAACGGKSFDAGNPNEGGRSGEGGSGSVSGHGGTTQNGGSTGPTPEAGSSSGGTGQGGQAPDACEAFNDEGGTYIQVEIVNDTANVIYLGNDTQTCSAPQLFSVEDESGQALTIDAECRTSCPMAGSDGPVGCPDLCRVSSVIVLQPGEQYFTNFSGLQYAAKKMPKECVTAPYGSADCLQALMLEPGTYTFSSIAGSAMECAVSSTQCGTCQPDGAGGCSVQGAVRSGTELHASTQAVLDGSYGIYPKKLPAPGEAPADEPGGSGALPAPRIRIVFF